MQQKSSSQNRLADNSDEVKRLKEELRSVCMQLNETNEKIKSKRKDERLEGDDLMESGGLTKTALLNDMKILEDRNRAVEWKLTRKEQELFALTAEKDGLKELVTQLQSDYKSKCLEIEQHQELLAGADELERNVQTSLSDAKNDLLRCTEFLVASQTVLAAIESKTVNLETLVETLLRGEQPDINLLLDDLPLASVRSITEDPKGVETLARLRDTLDTIDKKLVVLRNRIGDKYAEQVGSQCITQ